jgi:hypothetical protein
MAQDFLSGYGVFSAAMLRKKLHEPEGDIKVIHLFPL